MNSLMAERTEQPKQPKAKLRSVKLEAGCLSFPLFGMAYLQLPSAETAPGLLFPVVVVNTGLSPAGTPIQKGQGCSSEI